MRDSKIKLTALLAIGLVASTLLILPGCGIRPSSLEPPYENDTNFPRQYPAP